MGNRMASFRGHLTFSASLGTVLGGLSWWQLGHDPGTAALAGGLTAIGGMMPDLDSDSGVPVREMFNLAGVMIPLVLLRRIMTFGLPMEQVLVILGVLYLGIRHGASYVFKRMTVHRGMFHSVPAMFIAGLLTFLAYHHPDLGPRALLAIAVMVGFLSHLLLDELCAVDFRGLKPSLNQFAGSALKFGSKSRWATGITYALLLALSGLAFMDVRPRAEVVDPRPTTPTASIPGK
jgi:hypothetical protein